MHTSILYTYTHTYMHSTYTYLPTYEYKGIGNSVRYLDGGEKVTVTIGRVHNTLKITIHV